MHLPILLHVWDTSQAHPTSPDSRAGRPEPPPKNDLDKVGATAAEGTAPRPTRSEPHLRLCLCPDAARAGPANNKATPLRDIRVLLGGCGDARHFFMTLIDAFNSAKGPRLEGGSLRFVINDVYAELVARLYVLLVFLDRAARALPRDADALPRTKALPDAAVAALATFWHVYHSPLLAAPIHDSLAEVLQATVRAEAPPAHLAPWLRCTPGTWARIREVCGHWAHHGLSVEEDAATAAHNKEMESAHAAALPSWMPPGVQVRFAFRFIGTWSPVQCTILTIAFM